MIEPVPIPPIPSVSRPAPPVSRPPRPRKRSSGLALSTAKYLMRTDAHTFAFSVAANSILSFFPFVVLLMTLIRRVFHSRVMYDVWVVLLLDYLPARTAFLFAH